MDQTAFTDSRITRTVNHIHDGLYSLLTRKSYTDITIKDICNESQISRTTFYAHFKSKDDFVYIYLNMLLKNAKKKFLKEGVTTQVIFLNKMIHFWLSEGQLILKLLGDDSAYKIHQVIKKSIQQRIEINIVPVLNTKMLTTKEKYFLLIFMSNAVIGVLQDWVIRGYKESPKEVAEIMNKIFVNAFR
ncbi:TPA: TetR/AcrR family transcriptional regulator [Staphylococcus argenteus]|uniref:TetR/AcrR family transcriptional regulator n=1 Tax=Staphylococcus argenteus TaxID=985002 RepID=UPI000503B8E0|nr:TetR/AcrR family transcriptional regulator [Staphylococcus argenteus]MBE2135883.1 TetR/AcrR family transcriptional regulator [Staphylococcus argenteus]MDT3005212.1 TetR/AcrR family transcriptional regulator [Staphylococcus argenteus]UPO20549.1 TetR/AcrR family transcriptional regulator [Staphylococcus argenteus]CDR64055.1 tetR-family transcriptional regulator [Staphylococcus argenteus]HDY9446449.1 TetR/AcrR family transcriptional regulator [Staphylococcus argenteus]